MMWVVLRSMTNGDGSTTSLVVGKFRSEWEADRAARIFRDAHPTCLVGEATFFVRQWWILPKEQANK